MRRLLLLENWIAEWLARAISRFAVPGLLPAVAGPGPSDPLAGLGTRLCNSGGPCSRTRREKISASLFPVADGSRSRKGYLGASLVGELLAIHAGGRGLRDTALEILEKFRFESPEEAASQVEGIPSCKLHCRIVPQLPYYKGAIRDRTHAYHFLRGALILGRCRKGFYDPEAPILWTEKRLSQWVELYEIKRRFYS